MNENAFASFHSYSTFPVWASGCAISRFQWHPGLPDADFQIFLCSRGNGNFPPGSRRAPGGAAGGRIYFLWWKKFHRRAFGSRYLLSRYEVGVRVRRTSSSCVPYMAMLCGNPGEREPSEERRFPTYLGVPKRRRTEIREPSDSGLRIPHECDFDFKYPRDLAARRIGSHRKATIPSIGSIPLVRTTPATDSGHSLLLDGLKVERDEIIRLRHAILHCNLQETYVGVLYELLRIWSQQFVGESENRPRSVSVKPNQCDREISVPEENHETLEDQRMLRSFRVSLLISLIVLVISTSGVHENDSSPATVPSPTGASEEKVPSSSTIQPIASSRRLNNTELRKNQSEEKPLNVTTESLLEEEAVWECPNVTSVGVECSCDFPHTLRCTGDRTALQIINRHLRKNRGMVSLLDITIAGISSLPAHFLEDVDLHGLVISSGELRKVHEKAFTGLARPLQALGLPNNLLESVPTIALGRLIGLDRLDLSRNKLKTLEADSFLGLTNLTYLDLCDNLLSQLSPQAFTALPVLRSLRMRGNRLSVSALSALRGLKSLEELDLSNNLLIGPLGPNLLPRMPRLRYLTVAENELINVQQGALIGLGNLSYLSLSHNQIDVLEDHSFKYLSTLTRLDLANNRIVAVSSASLAHLEKLVTLDLTYNFLRSLTADLVIPLKSLQDLRLDDNDITMVSSEVPTSKLKLKRLSLAHNPLNCDCTLLEFANWLTNSSLDEEDKSSAVCATPPALENGILTQVSPGNLLCGDPTPPIITRVPLAGTQLDLKEFHYQESSGVTLLWHVEACLEHYTCDTLIIYETVGDSEVEIESSPLRCDSSTMRDPCSLPVSIPPTTYLQTGHKYRFCIVLLIPTGYDDISLGLGCSDIITLESTVSLKEESTTPGEPGTSTGASKPGKLTTTTTSSSSPRITAVHANISDRGFLHVDVSLSETQLECELLILIFVEGSVAQRRKINCSSSFLKMDGLSPGRYKICASLDPVDGILESQDPGKSRCIEVESTGNRNTELIIVLAVGALVCVVLVAALFIGYSLVKRMKPQSRMPPQCFLPTQEFEIAHKAHYIKLLATTKV